LFRSSERGHRHLLQIRQIGFQLGMAFAFESSACGAKRSANVSAFAAGRAIKANKTKNAPAKAAACPHGRGHSGLSCRIVIEIVFSS
jgi:hypothetical protein